MRDSLITKITIIFGIAFVLVCILFTTFSKIQTSKEFAKMQALQISSINYLINLYEKDAPPKNIQMYFKTYNLKIIRSKKVISSVLKNKEVLYTQKTPLGEFLSIKYEDKLYLYLKNESFSVLFESIETKNLNDPIWIGFFLATLLLAIMYFSMLKSLSPLKKLSKNVQKFGAGNFEAIKLNITEDNEIAKLAREFNQAAIKIQELITSRQLFLRTIMHELKTPIAKGRIVSEMLEDEVSKKRLLSVFERLEMLINEFAKVEQLLAKNYNLKFEQFPLSVVLDQAIDILMLDNSSSVIKTSVESDPIIMVDFQLFSLAIKNLIDNALKYSSDKKVYIDYYKNKICVKNRGKELNLSIEHYKQAFVRNEKEKVSGMGLGLYIIDKICEMHNFRLDYSYEDGFHIFCIVFKD